MCLGLRAITVSGFRGSELPEYLGWVITEGSVLTLRATHILCVVHAPVWVECEATVDLPPALTTLAERR